MYKFISFHKVNQYHTKRDVFSLSKNQHDYIGLFIFTTQNKKLIKKLALRHNIACFALFRQQKNCIMINASV